jgi:hypothetical protein
MKELAISKKLAASKLNYLLQAHHVIGSVNQTRGVQRLPARCDNVRGVRPAGGGLLISSS